MTDESLQRLAKAEFALTAAEEEVLAALDDDQGESLYQLLQQAVSALPSCDARRAPLSGSGHCHPQCLGPGRPAPFQLGRRRPCTGESLRKARPAAVMGGDAPW